MSETRLKHKENQTNYRKMTRVRILIHRTWAFCSTCSPITVADPDIQIRGVGSGHPDPEIRRGEADLPWIRHCIIYTCISTDSK